MRHVFLASLRRRRLATALSLFAIALGVALGLAVQLIHGAALDEFGRGMRLLAGEADLQVFGPRAGFDDAVYAEIAAQAEVADASPVLEIDARLPGRDISLRIFGIDMFRAAHVHPALMPQVDTAARETGPLAALAADALFLSPAARTALGIAPGEMLAVQSGTHALPLRIAGTVPAAGLGQELGVMDIAAAQLLFGRIGRISRIDLRLKSGIDRDAARRSLAALLPAGVEVLTPETAEAQTSALSQAYRVNLTMLAIIALLTGGFLVFSTQLLAVARRRQELAFLRALGLDRAALIRGLLAEGAVVGLTGGLLGIVLAYGLAGLAFNYVGGDLGAGYFRGLRPALRFDLRPSVAYVLLGVLAGVAGAWLPAREAARMNPARALRAGDEAEVFQSRPRAYLTPACLALATLLCFLPPLGGVPIFGYAAVAFLLAGAVLALPTLVQLSMGFLDGTRDVLWMLARARLAAAPGQAVVAAAGVVASVALAVAMAIMVSSFRHSVDGWLESILPADLYLSASPAATSGFLAPEMQEQVASLPGIAAIRPVRFDTLRLDTERFPVTLIARPVDGGAALPLVGATVTADSPDAAPSAWISEAMADLFAVKVGDVLQLPISGRRVAFHVAGIWRDYARQHGAVVIELADYRALTGDFNANDLAIWLADGAEPDTVAQAIRNALGDDTIKIASPGDIRAISLAIFDRTFLVTYLMEAVAILIGLFGVSTSFAGLATARRKEFGMLRHLGLTRGEIGRLLTVEGALTAAVGTAVGMVAGGAIALVLVEVINRQSFHWSMDIRLPLAGLVIFAGALVLLAALAARLSGHQAMRQSAVLAVREDW
nr:FtsX-like permease family protein [Aromatoleum diolicum]